jgi:hypothetical protein
MIIVKLMGGLGNQLFQYAAGRRLAQSRAVPLQLDISWFASRPEEVTPRKYELEHFAIREEFASADQVRKYSRFSNKLMGDLRIALPLCPQYVRERHFHFDERLMNLGSNVYLDGYWQSEKYFAEIGAIIRQEFTVKHAPAGLNKAIAEEIAAARSAVAIHVRRGDYSTNRATHDYHGLCPPEYYHEAVAQLAARLPDPRFYIFSDDPEWVSRNLHIDHPFTVLTHNGAENAHEDLRLMTLCRHHIIANSTFSWWGAWLSAHPEKTVIAPRRWFNDPAVNAADLLPAAWETL